MTFREPDTPIADLVQQLLAENVAADVVVAAVATAERARRMIGRDGQRGQRLAADWQPSQTDTSFAARQGMTRHQIDLEAEKFRNYWTAKSGQGAAKVNWAATWRNWIINAVEHAHG